VQYHIRPQGPLKLTNKDEEEERRRRRGGGGEEEEEEERRSFIISSTHSFTLFSYLSRSLSGVSQVCLIGLRCVSGVSQVCLIGLRCVSGVSHRSQVCLSRVSVVSQSCLSRVSVVSQVCRASYSSGLLCAAFSCISVSPEAHPPTGLSCCSGVVPRRTSWRGLG